MKKKFRSFKDARKFVHLLKLEGQTQWREYCKSNKKPDNIPSKPDYVYKNNDWNGYGDWLGTGNVANRNKEFCSFDNAKKFVQKLNLKSRTAWREYRKSGKKPDNIPSNPEIIYKNKGWKNISDFLGTGTISPRDKVFRSFEDVKKFAQSQKIKSQREWFDYCKSGKKPDNIPVKPQNTYKKKWKNWGDFFDTGRIADQNKVFRDFKKAREFAHSLNLKNRTEWTAYCKSGKKPDDIPLAVWKTYKNEWRGRGDFLGTGIIATQERVYRSFPEARKFIQSLNLKTQKEWMEYCASGNKPDDIPSAPWYVYSKKKKQK